MYTVNTELTSLLCWQVEHSGLFSNAWVRPLPSLPDLLVCISEKIHDLPVFLFQVEELRGELILGLLEG